MNKKAVLLINLGTPGNCDNQSVYTYLKEFLIDPRVIDLPSIFRWLLVNTIILPFRYKKTAKAYAKIWEKEGSPLLIHSKALTHALAAKLGDEYQVELGMRYGQPSISTALDKIKQTDKLIVIPLFPQFTSAATGSAIEKLMLHLHKQWNIPELIIKHDFYQDPGFINAYSLLIKSYLEQNKIEKLIFSYHGLPERHINKSQCRASCDRLSNCPHIHLDNRYCYRAQCHATTQLIAKQLALQSNQYCISFQSRLGRTPWIKPYTDLLLPDLIQQGVKHIAMVCPSFVSDCLETLEEVNIRTRAQWLALGGENFTFIPCLNDTSAWVDALANIIIN